MLKINVLFLGFRHCGYICLLLRITDKDVTSEYIYKCVLNRTCKFLSPCLKTDWWRLRLITPSGELEVLDSITIAQRMSLFFLFVVKIMVISCGRCAWSKRSNPLPLYHSSWIWFCWKEIYKSPTIDHSRNKKNKYERK